MTQVVRVRDNTRGFNSFCSLFLLSVQHILFVYRVERKVVKYASKVKRNFFFLFALYSARRESKTFFKVANSCFEK